MWAWNDQVVCDMSISKLEIFSKILHSKSWVGIDAEITNFLPTTTIKDEVQLLTFSCWPWNLVIFWDLGLKWMLNLSLSDAVNKLWVVNPTSRSFCYQNIDLTFSRDVYLTVMWNILFWNGMQWLGLLVGFWLPQFILENILSLDYAMRSWCHH